MKTTETEYYVLPEGATQEELLSWEAIERMCRSGQFSPDTRIFFPDKNTWVKAGDTELKELFASDVVQTVAGHEAECEEPGESELEAEYRDATRRISENPGETEPLVEAGRLAVEMGDRRAARGHFQEALRIKPFNSRIAQEVMRRFNKTECRQFEYLRREPAAWEDPVDLLSYPLRAGVLYWAVPAAVLLALLLVPFGYILAAPLVYLWCLKIARHSAGGSKLPPHWDSARENPTREIILPLTAGVAVLAECILVVYGVGRLSMMPVGEEGSVFAYVDESPVLSVTLTFVALAYLPAVFVRITHSVGIIVDLLSPWTVIRAIIRMDQEYVVSALLVLVVFFVLFGLNYLLGSVPVLGKAVLAAAAAYAIPVVGFIMGRLAGRMPHLL